MIIVQKQSGANSVEISNAVMEALPRLQKNLPSDVKLGVIVDTSDNIRNTIDTLFETVILALPLCRLWYSCFWVGGELLLSSSLPYLYLW